MTIVCSHFSLVIDHVTKRNKGYAFVDFNSIEDAANAIKHTNGAIFFGRQLHVEFSNRSSNLDGKGLFSTVSLIVGPLIFMKL